MIGRNQTSKQFFFPRGASKKRFPLRLKAWIRPIHGAGRVALLLVLAGTIGPARRAQAACPPIIPNTSFLTGTPTPPIDIEFLGNGSWVISGLGDPQLLKVTITPHPGAR